MRKQLRLLAWIAVSVCLLLLTSCAPAQTVTEYGELNYPGLKWYMTPQEVFKALDKDESDFQIKEIGTAGDLDYEKSYTIDGSLFGNDAEIQLSFFPTADGNDMALWAVSVYLTEASEENYTVLLQALEKEFANQKADVQKAEYVNQIVVSEDGNESLKQVLPNKEVYDAENVIGFEKGCRFSSVTQATDLPQEMQERFKEGADAFYKEHPTETPVQELQQQTLSSVTLSYTERKDDSDASSLLVSFNGSGICTVLKYANL